MIENLREFVVEPGPEDYLVHCRITRNNKGIDHGRIPFYPFIPSDNKVLREGFKKTNMSFYPHFVDKGAGDGRCG